MRVTPCDSLEGIGALAISVRVITFLAYFYQEVNPTLLTPAAPSVAFGC